MVLLVLAIIWAAVLLPPLVRSRLEGHPTDSVGRFRRHLRILESTSPAASSLAHDPVLVNTRPGAPPATLPATWANEARRLRLMRRRQQVAFILLGVASSTLVLGLLPTLRPVLALHVLADIAFVAYVVMLAKARQEEMRRTTTGLRSAQAEMENEQEVALVGIDPSVQRQAL